MHFVIGFFIVFWVLGKIGGCSESSEVKAQRERRYKESAERQRYWEESAKRGREQGEEADKAIREANSSKRADLERRSVKHRMSNRNGVRVDQYTMPNGTVVTCTSTISGNAPAMFNCD
jgi:hypothetical protein